MAHPDILGCTNVIGAYIDRALRGDRLAARICMENQRKRAKLLGWDLASMHERELEAARRQRAWEDYIPGAKKIDDSSSSGLPT